MVGGEYVDGATWFERSTDGVSVHSSFDRGVPFDVRSPFCIVGIGKPQMVRAGLCRDALF